MTARIHSGELWKEIKRNRVAYAYIAPFYVLFAIFGLFPIVMGISLGFFQWRGTVAPVFIGLKNYFDLFNQELFRKSLVNTAVMGVSGNAVILTSSLVLAYILNSRLVRHPDVFKTIFFLPMITSAVAASVVFRALFSNNSGIFNFFLQMLGFERVFWLGGTGDYIKIAVIIMFSWQWIGWNIVIYLAGMQGISHDVIESAIVDGASHVRIFLNITLPLLKPIILFTLIQNTIGTINLFTEPYMLTGAGRMDGGANYQGLTAMMWLLNQAPYGTNNYGLASACANILCLIIIIISVFLTNLMGEKEDPGPIGRRAGA